MSDLKMSELEKNVKASSVMSFVGSVVGAYESGFIDNHPTIYDIYRSAQNHVKDNYGIDTDNWDDLLAKESRHDSHDRIVEENAQLKADKAELVESFDELLYWASLKMDKYGQVIECEEGAGKFVSSGALNGIVSRLKRAVKDEDYKSWLLQKHKGDSDVR